MVPPTLTRRQQEIYEYLREHLDDFPHPPTLDELCDALGLELARLAAQTDPGPDRGRAGRADEQPASRHPPVEEDMPPMGDSDALPLYGYIAAGRPIEAISNPEMIDVPAQLRSGRPLLCARGTRRFDDRGRHPDGDWVVIEHRDHARNGEIVVALVDGEEATLKRLEAKSGEVVLHPANSRLAAMHYSPERVQVQGVLVGQMRRYH